MADGRNVSQIKRRGQQVYLMGLDFPVTLSWYWVKKDDGTFDKRFVVSTKPLSGAYITILGIKRWLIESFFKLSKHRFSLDNFGQNILLGVYRWLVLSLIAYFLVHLASLWSGKTILPDWAELSQLALVALFPNFVVVLLIIQIKRLHYIKITFCGINFERL